MNVRVHTRVRDYQLPYISQRCRNQYGLIIKKNNECIFYCTEHVLLLRRLSGREQIVEFKSTTLYIQQVFKENMLQTKRRGIHLGQKSKQTKETGTTRNKQHKTQQTFNMDQFWNFLIYKNTWGYQQFDATNLIFRTYSTDRSVTPKK